VLAGIDTPALVIQGARDRLVPMGAARYYAEHLSRARLAPISGAGHAPFLSHPAEFLVALKAFIHGDGAGEHIHD
jgi:pimeloyl-[acyl-carrier protein] methyl ester esterase